ncbi:MAG: GTPase domain-containing protein [Deltaproteobacteria bacterium]|nr:GTPase domain-containing protein [Deltaproteobacteria bacterium]
MAFVNVKKNEVQVKIVYYGPGRGGKTSNLEYVHSKFTERVKTDLVAIKTQGDRTLFFDFLPFDMGQIKGYDVKVQLYTVPGQVMYNATRKLVLRGVDGVVFVADSLESRRKKNLISLKNLQQNLKVYNKNIFKIPLVLQYNKRDLAEHGIPLLPIKALEKDLNSKLKVPSYEASALVGTNVAATLKSIIVLTMNSIENKLL